MVCDDDATLQELGYMATNVTKGLDDIIQHVKKGIAYNEGVSLLISHIEDFFEHQHTWTSSHVVTVLGCIAKLFPTCPLVGPLLRLVPLKGGWMSALEQICDSSFVTFSK